MDILLFILGAIFIIVAIFGSVLPALPGPPFGYLGLLMIHLTDKVQYETSFLLMWLGIVLVVTLLDNILPLWSTKVLGGSKWAMWGSVIGLIFGFIMPPIGILLGTLLGAIIGEMLSGKTLMHSLKAGLGAFVGFIITTGAKLVCCGYFVYYYFIQLL